MKITVFTPTYNRAYILPCLYKSLCNQSNKNFEWLIVDDGSTDDTESLVKDFIEQDIISIRYYKQENKGKSQAHNLGVKLAYGELFTCVDSDDYLEHNAIDIIIKSWSEKTKNCIGIVAKRKKNNGEDITKSKILDGTYFNLRNSYEHKKIMGDTFLIFEISEIRKYCFPQIRNEKFVPEAYIYDRISTDGDFLMLQQSLYVCDYLLDGYTQNMSKLIANNPYGYREFLKYRITNPINTKEKILNIVKYQSISFVIGEGFLYLKCKFLCFITILPGWLLYLKRFKKYVKK